MRVKHILIIKLFGCYRQLHIMAEDSISVANTGGQLGFPALPIMLLYACDFVYDTLNNIIIKNTYSKKSPDFIVMQQWMNVQLPIYEYPGHKQFRKDSYKYQLTNVENSV